MIFGEVFGTSDMINLMVQGWILIKLPGGTVDGVSECDGRLGNADDRWWRWWPLRCYWLVMVHSVTHRSVLAYDLQDWAIRN